MGALLGAVLVTATAAFPAHATPPPPAVKADAWVLMAVRSGRVLASVHADEPRPAGSLAKLMTAYLTFRAATHGQISLDDPVRVTKHEWEMSGSQMFLKVGEDVTVDQLLQGMLVAGGNDAAHALARHVSGSVEAFVQLMNRQARVLGLDDTHFTNPSGLPDPHEQMSAHDAAVLASDLVRRFPGQYQRFSARSITHSGIKQRNRNPVLGVVIGADGLITGHTAHGGYDLVASAARDHMRLIAVLLGTHSRSNRLADANAMLSYGFREFVTLRVKRAGETVAQARVWMGAADHVPAALTQDLYVTVPRHEMDSVEARAKFPPTLEAPLQEGQQIGALHVTDGDQPIAHAPLVAMRKVASSGWIQYAIDSVELRWQTFWRRQRQDLLAGKPGTAVDDGDGPPG